MSNQSNMLSKILVIGIIFLFIFMSIIPSVAVDTLNIEHANGKSSSDDTDWWPMFRHDPQHSGYSTSNAPNTNNVLWSYTTGDLVESSPAIVDGKVYFGSDDYRVYCLDAYTGDYIWSYTTESCVSGSSPAVADGRVYVGSTDDNVYCLDAHTGDYIWSYTTGDKVYSSPAVADGKVYIGSDDDNVYCLNADSGDFIWSYTTGDNIWYSSPAVADSRVYFGSRDCNVYCLNAVNGSKLWDFDTGWRVDSSPAVADGKVYIGSDDDNVYCLDASTGDFIWSYTTGGGVDSSPAVADGKLYIGSDDDNVYCLNAISGDYIWSYETGDQIYSSPAVADGKVYIGSRDCNVVCLDAHTGEYIWSYTIGNWVISSSAIANGNVYIGGSKPIGHYKVYCFGDPSQPPEVPTIDGPTRGKHDIEYNYTFVTEDPEGDDVFYYIDWYSTGDGYWIGPYTSGEKVILPHIWPECGIFTISAMAKDIFDAESNWAYYEVEIPRYRASVNSLFQLLFDRFPLLEVIILRAMNLLR